MTRPYDPPNALPTNPELRDNAIERTRTQRIASKFVAVPVFVTAALGLQYNFSSIQGLLSRDVPMWTSPPFLAPAYWTMSLICMVFYAGLIYYSVRLWNGISGAARSITCIFAAEITYFFGIPFLWSMPKIGRGVSAATGVANGGLMVQFLILLPLWAPIAFLVFRLYDQHSTHDV